jgi:hypothetical protein
MIHVLHVYIAVNDWWILMIQHWWLMIHEYWLMNIDQSLTISGWWFQTFFIFHNIWDNPAHSLIFFKMVKTTNQILIDDYWSILMSHLVTPSPWHDSSLGWFFEISRPGTLFTFRWTSIQHRYNDIYIYTYPILVVFFVGTQFETLILICCPKRERSTNGPADQGLTKQDEHSLVVSPVTDSIII